MAVPIFAARRTWVAVALSLSVTGGLAGCAQPAPDAAAQPAVSAAARGRALPAGSSRAGQLSAVAAVSARSAWAVGVTNRRRPLIERWDGTTWSRVISPDPGPAGGFVPLQGVSAPSARDAWAVGEVADGGHTLIVHWDGTAWRRVPSPSPSGGGNVLNAVAAGPASSAWAVGYAGSSSILATTLIEHWNGRAWSHVPSPAPQPGCGGCQFPGDRLAGAAATSAANAWAVGSSGHGALIEHWDGTRWRWVRTGDAALPGAGLAGVAATSADDAWAVGTADGKTLTEHWNGTAWTRVPSPSPASADVGSQLNSVAAVSPSSAWAAGYSGNQTLILHWDGNTWTQVPAPSPGDEPEFLGVTVTSGSAWAVGLDGSDDTLIARWNGTTWTRQPDRQPR